MHRSRSTQGLRVAFSIAGVITSCMLLDADVIAATPHPVVPIAHVACATSSPVAFAQPAVEFKLCQGDCSAETTWWMVSEYQDGRLMAMHGVDCDGKEWHRPGASVVPEDPTAGEPPTFTGVGANGVAWFACVHVEDGVVTWQGGRDSNGNYWAWNDAAAGGSSRACRRGIDNIGTQLELSLPALCLQRELLSV